jgi:hypothetical protein
MSDDREEGFARRWSRLKHQARESPPQEAPPPDLPATVPAADGPPPEAEEKKKEEKPFDPADLPPVESLTKESDYSLFMRPEVPEELRRKALRQLWATDPVLSAPDLFDMHNLDYNAVPTFPEGVQTLYRVGQGMFDALEAEAEKAAAEKAAAERSADKPADSAAQPRDAGPETPGTARGAEASDFAAQQDISRKRDDSGQTNS